MDHWHADDEQLKRATASQARRMACDEGDYLSGYTGGEWEAFKAGYALAQKEGKEE